jgi:hypothetical protein
MIIGLFLIIMGVLWVLTNAGVISANMEDFIWPIVLIAIGGQILFDHYRKGSKVAPFGAGKDCCKPKEDK